MMWRLKAKTPENIRASRTNVSVGYLMDLEQEVADLKDSQMRLVDALKACKERNGETE